MLRIRPLLLEATVSYLHRLAEAYRLALPQLLDGTGITLDEHSKGTAPAAELQLNTTAQHRLAALTAIPLAHLTRTLPSLTRRHATDRDHAPGSDAGEPAVAHWRTLEGREQSARACTTCTQHRSNGATGTAWLYRPAHQLVCPRHQQAAPDPRLAATVHTGSLPELQAAHFHHQRLNRHPRARSAWQTAHAITTRWYDHDQHCAPRWHQRLNRLATANPHLTTGALSPARLARDLVTYPETVALARTLATLTRPTHGTTSDTLTRIAHRIGLDRLIPAPHDPLTAWLEHTTR